MEFNEKTFDRTVIYNGKIIDLEIHDVELPDGNTSRRELVYHNGAVASPISGALSFTFK